MTALEIVLVSILVVVVVLAILNANAANCHADLLAACEAAHDELGVLHDQIEELQLRLPIGHIADLMDRLAAALNKARGK